MSAITGIFMRNGTDVDPELMKKMNDKLSHRGPDGSSLWCEGSVGLGHQMLWTTPESLQETLPLEEDGLVITADARIDNRAELSEKLGIQDEEDVSDSYFILKAYAKWGDECPDKLLGDFAFAIWYKQEEKLFCARDHMGVKPFYYYLDEDMFVFGTEIKAILSHPTIKTKLNPKKIALFLMRDIFDDEITFYKQIYCLPAANFQIINKKKTVIGKYWELNPDLSIKLNSEEEYAKAFLEIFSESIRCRLRSNYPIGFELSGGLDSSSIVSLTKRLMEDNIVNLETINTFSSVYDEIPESDERYYIKKVLDDKINSKFTYGDDISPLEDINDILWHQDQPFFSPHMTNQIASYKKMSENGIRILFSGEGGDQIVSHGGNLLRELFLDLKLKKFITELNGQSRNFNQKRYKIFWNEVLFPSLPYFLKKLIQRVLKTNKEFLVNKNLLKKLDMEILDMNVILDHLGKINTKEYHYFSINTPLSQTIFGIIDRSTSIVNIEERYPFFDKRLIEFCYSLPTDMKLREGWDRYIMRIAMENVLPVEIQWRKQKSNLSEIYKRNLMLFEKSTLEKIIYAKKSPLEEYVDLDILKSNFEKYNSRKGNNLFDIWIVILLNFWIKQNDLKSK